MGNSPHIADGHKAFIRDLTEEAICAGYSATQLKALRAELATDLNVGVRSVASTGAYVQYSATETLADLNLGDRLTNKDLIKTARTLRSASDAEATLAQASATLNVDSNDLKRAASRYDQYLSGRPGGLECCTPESQTAESDEFVGLANELTVPSRPQEASDVADSKPVQPFIRVKGGGDLADYDYPEKRLWRADWANYIEERLPQNERATARVICLPGCKVEPEVSHYLRLGIRPENIYAVERSPRVREEFVDNAKRLGIRYFTESLEKVLKGLKEPFRIVNYDFLGPSSMGHTRLLWLTPVTPRCILIYNVMAKRESSGPTKDIDDAFENRRAVHKTWLSSIAHPHKEGHELNARELERLFNRRSVPPIPNVSEARFDILPGEAVRALGAARRTMDLIVWDPLFRGMFPSIGPMAATLKANVREQANRLGHTEEVVREVIDEQLALLFRRAIDNLPVDFDIEAASALKWLLCQVNQSAPSKFFKDCDIVAFTEAYVSALKARRESAEITLVQYYSEVNKGGPRSPFMTVYSDTILPQQSPVTHQAALRFFSSLIAMILTRQCAQEPGAGRKEYFRINHRAPQRNFATNPTLDYRDEIWVNCGGPFEDCITAGELRQALIEVVRDFQKAGIKLR